jgi:ribosomal protein L15E
MGQLDSTCRPPPRRLVRRPGHGRRGGGGGGPLGGGHDAAHPGQKHVDAARVLAVVAAQVAACKNPNLEAAFSLYRSRV